ncbi:MAG: hypothetical protein JWQ18_2150 [Conexibacter sp.]|nr:hypothetical protein [Conexibacter sp.]
MRKSYEIHLIMLHGVTPVAQEARQKLASALGDGASVSEADEIGTFAVTLEASHLDDALTTVWDAVALSGTDDHLVFLEHPELPEHWRSRSLPPGHLPGGLG